MVAFLAARLSPTFRQRLSTALLVPAIFHLLIQLGVWLPQHWQRTDTRRDLAVYYYAARRVIEDKPLYRPWPDYNLDVFPNRYLYPPPFAAAIAPLGHLSFVWFARVWYLVLLVAFWIYAWSLARLAHPGGNRRETIHAVLIAGMILAFCPESNGAMSVGNAEPILWALFGLGLTTRLRGAAFAAGALVKIHPLWPLLLASRYEGARVLRPAAAVLLVGIIGSWLVCGSEAWLAWWPAVSPVVSQGSFTEGNVSLSFLGLRLARLLGWEYAGGPLPVGARLYLSVMAIAGPLGVAWLLRREQSLTQYAWVALAAMLFAPLCWTLYLPLLLAPAAVWTGERQSTADTKATERA